MVKTPYEEEQLTDGFLYQKYHLHIHSFTFSSVTKETVDTAYELITGLDQEYAKNGFVAKYLYILDQVRLSPYALLRLKQAVDVIPDNLKESVAVVADAFLMRVLETLLKPILKLVAPDSVRFFTTETEAFEWFESLRNEGDE